MKKVNRAQMQVVSSQFTVHRKTDNREPTTVNRKAFGFSLIELVIVITIIAILVGAISVSWAKAQEKARDNRRKNDLKGIQQALDTYYDLTGTYPIAIFPGKITCYTYYDSPVYTGAIKSWGSKFSCIQTIPDSQEITFLQQLPRDPRNVAAASLLEYHYFIPMGTPGTPPYRSYILSASLENTKDPENTSNPDYVSGTLNCTPQNSRNYCVTNP